MKLISHHQTLECPICNIVLLVIEQKYQVAVEARHPASSCVWSEYRFRANPRTGDAERIQEKTA